MNVRRLGVGGLLKIFCPIFHAGGRHEGLYTEREAEV